MAVEHGVSKSNLYEVDMVVATIKYLVQQGYKTEQLVVLTPYLGQLVEIQRALTWQGGLGAQLGERDEQELVEAAVEQQDSKPSGGSGSSGTGSGSVGGTSGKGVRVATIDNFQVCP